MAENRFVQCFNYSSKRLLLVHSFAVFLLLIIICGLIVIENGEYINGFLIIAIGLIIYSPIYINSILLTSVICVDIDGVMWSLGGLVWKRIQWHEIVRIRVLRFYNIGHGKKVNLYCLDKTERCTFYLSKNGPILFDETITDMKFLIDIVNHYVDVYKIPIFTNVKDGENSKDRAVYRVEKL